jgi:hypothetical protein
MTDATDKLIREYIDAYRARNTMNEPPDITYASGWFTLKSPRLYGRKYRRHAIEAMRDNLRRQNEQAALAAGKP